MSKLNVFFRVDANSKIGSGHLKRCEIIAQEFLDLQFNLNVYFILKETCKNYEVSIENDNLYVVRLNENNNNQADLLEQLEILNNFKKNILIVDSNNPFYYTKKYQKSIKNTGTKLVLISFWNDRHFYADIVHNQNIRAPYLSYSCESYTKLLLGLEYVILNKRFREINETKKNGKINSNSKFVVFVSFGGSDQMKITAKVLQAIRDFKGLKKIIVVIGSMYVGVHELKKIIKSISVKTEFYQNTDKMAELMEECDIAITSSGLTIWELAALNKANIIIPTSSTEKITTNFIADHDLAYIIDPEDNLREGILNFFSEYNKMREQGSKLMSKIKTDGVTHFCNRCLELIN